MAPVPPDTAAGDSQDATRGTRLDSWKEIAAFLNRDVATVRRWEKREGLPVHRHHHHKLGSVYAFASELGTWSEGRRQPLDPQAAVESSGPVRRPVLTPAVAAAAAAAVVLLASIAWYVWTGERRTARSGTAGVTSLAVLPFQPLGDAARDEALELGMTDALIMRLGSVARIRVRPLSSVLRYSDPRRDLDAAGRELGVDAIVDAKMQRDGDRIRVTVQVLRVRDGVLSPIGPFDERFTDIFKIQDSISHQVASALALTLNRSETDRLRRRDPKNTAAYEPYLRGRDFMAQGVGESVQKAVQAFEQAIQLDSSFALAYAGLSSAYAAQANSTIIRSKDAYSKARGAAEKALSLDPSLAEAHTTMGAVALLYEWDWSTAEQAFKRALGHEPENAWTLRRYAIGLMWLGRSEEAIEKMKRARDLAPVDLEVSANLALVYYYAHDYDKALAAARKTLDMDAGFSQAHRTIARCLVELRSYEDAIIAYRKAIAPGGVQLLTAELGHAFALAGRRAEALKIRDELRELRTRRYVSPYDMAILHIGLREYDQAFDWLEKSYGERERWMVTLKVAPALEPLRPDPRFTDLMRRVRLWQ